MSDLKSKIAEIMQQNDVNHSRVYHLAVADKLLALLVQELHAEREIGEMRYYGCNPDEDRGWNEYKKELLRKWGIDG